MSHNRSRLAGALLVAGLSTFVALADACSGCAPPVEPECTTDFDCARGEVCRANACVSAVPVGEGEGDGGEGEAGEGEGDAGEGEGDAGEGEGEGEGEGDVGAGIDALYAASPGAVSITLSEVVVTEVIPAVGGDPSGFFVQDTGGIGGGNTTGPAVFVAQSPVAVEAGEVVSFTATSVQRVSGQTRVTALSSLSFSGGGAVDVETLRQDVSDVDLADPSALDSLESELVTLHAHVETAPASAGTGHSAFEITSAGVSSPTQSVVVRMPDAALAAAGSVVAGCDVTLKGAMWRFNDRAQPSAWDGSELTVDACPAARLLSAAAVDASHVALTFSGAIDPDSATAGAFTISPAADDVVASVAVAGAVVTIATGATLSDGSYSVGVDGSVLDLQGEAVGPLSAVVTLCFAVPARVPVISEVAWMGSDASAGDEWIEIFNADVDGAAICDLSQFVLVGAGTAGANVALPPVQLAAGELLVVEHTPGASGVSFDAQHAVVAPDMNLANAGEVLRLCPAAHTGAGDAALCDIANAGGGSWFAGVNTVPKKTMERTSPDADGSFGTSWTDGAPSSPGTAAFAGPPAPVTLVSASAVDASTVVLTFSGNVDAASVTAAAFVLTPSGDVDTAGGNGTSVTLTLTSALADGSYTVDVDSTVLDTFARPVGPGTASFAVGTPPPPDILPIITEVAWMGSDASANDEWIELFNPGDHAITDLSQFLLVGAGGASANLALPPVQLAAGELFIIERTAGATHDAAVDASGAGHHVVDATMSLSNAGEVLLLCPVATAGDASTCDVANPANAPWFAGSNSTPKATMERRAPDADGALRASWRNGSPSSPLVASFDQPAAPAQLVSAQSSDATHVVLTFDGAIDATTVAAAAFTLTAAGGGAVASAVTNATTSGVTVTLVTTDALPDGDYIVDVDDTVRDANGRVAGPASASFTVQAPTAPAVLPIITEVAWMGSDASANDEWIELFNPADASDPNGTIESLAQFVLVGAGASTANINLPAVALAAGQTFIVEKTAGATGDAAVVAGQNAFVSSVMNLANAGEVLMLCPIATAADPSTCDVANASATAWPAGRNSPTPKLTMERRQPDSDGALASSWKDGAPSSPLVANFDGPPPPAQLTSAVAVDASTVVLTFSGDLDASAVLPAAFALAFSPGGGAAASVVTATVTSPPPSSAQVTLTTSAPLDAGAYTASVDGTVLDVNANAAGPGSADFTVGGAPAAVIIDSVAVTSTNPDNGALVFNTGTFTVHIAGSGFTTVTCGAGGGGTAVGVALDDSLSAPTAATSCTVVDDTAIDATFPRGVSSTGDPSAAGAGHHVVVTSSVSGTATSADAVIVRAGLVISEVLVAGANGAQHEFLELWNATSTPIDISKANGIGLRLHVRNSTPTDTNKTLTFLTTSTLAPQGFFLFASAATTSADPWFADRDATYLDGLVSNGGAYVSLSDTSQALVIDKVGWGTQQSGGFEGTATANIGSNQSIERRPAGGAGHDVDTDVNLADFNAPSTTSTPHGTSHGAEP